MCTQITVVRRAADGDVSRVGGDRSPGRTWALPAEEVISRIESRQWDFFVDPAGDGTGRTPVLVRERRGRKYLTTGPDEVPPNNLHSLPDSSALDQDSEPSWPDSLPPARLPSFVEARRRGRLLSPAKHQDVPPPGTDREVLRALPTSGITLVVDAPWPADIDVRLQIDREHEPGSDLPRLLRSPTIRTRWPEQDDSGWWSVLDIVPGTRTASRWTLLIVPPATVRAQLRPVRIEIRSVSLNSQCDPAAHVSKPLLVQLVRYGARSKLLKNVPDDEMRTLARGIQNAVVDLDLITLHGTFTHSASSEFLLAHRDVVAKVEAHLAEHGLDRFVPLPYWRATDSIPKPFRTLVPGAEGDPPKDDDPDMPAPADIRFPFYGPYTTDLAFAGALIPWHGQVHKKVGGAMKDAHTSAGALIFYPWHAYVDELWWTWQFSPLP